MPSNKKKIIPKKNKCNKAKRFSKEALQTVEKRREAKGRGQKERHTHLMQSSKNSKER